MMHFVKRDDKKQGTSQNIESHHRVNFPCSVLRLVHEGRQFWVVAAERESAGRFIDCVYGA
jgi:hypothetical protein